MFERGFKAWCEKYSAEKRGELGLRPSDPLDAFALAKSLNIRVLTPDDIPGLKDVTKAVLLRNDGKTPSCWSAVTLVVGNKTAVILNSSHSAGRQASDLTHELAHRIRNHQPHDVRLSPGGIMLLSSYEKVQEEEADWLAGCLLLPREALVQIKLRRLLEDIAAQTYGVSVRMLRYRMAMCGIGKQFS